MPTHSGAARSASARAPTRPIVAGSGAPPTARVPLRGRQAPACATKRSKPMPPRTPAAGVPSPCQLANAVSACKTRPNCELPISPLGKLT